MFPIHLDAKTTRQKAREAYDAGILFAQTHNSDECTYADCAIGITLTPEQRIAVQAKVEHTPGSYRVEKLAERGFFTSDDMPGMTRIQQAHDSWAFGLRASELEFLAELAR
jgi:hypothetical protein